MNSHRINPRILKHARDLRKPLTPPETLLWSRLRNRQLGRFKFRRQHPIGRYIVDFCCTETRLVIELDGDSHAEQEEYDRKRTQEIVEQGYHEMRFNNRDVFKNLDGILEMILLDCESTIHPPLTPPFQGGGLETNP
ncbi:MAG: endonuclease domain-containing protein [Chloroflexi bacterium]|nr:endonuclease domain-containing protein [Chloroflexota bacterium]